MNTDFSRRIAACGFIDPFGAVKVIRDSLLLCKRYVFIFFHFQHGVIDHFTDIGLHLRGRDIHVVDFTVDILFLIRQEQILQSRPLHQILLRQAVQGSCDVFRQFQSVRIQFIQHQSRDIFDCARHGFQIADQIENFEHINIKRLQRRCGLCLDDGRADRVIQALVKMTIEGLERDQNAQILFGVFQCGILDRPQQIPFAAGKMLPG